MELNDRKVDRKPLRNASMHVLMHPQTDGHRIGQKHNALVDHGMAQKSVQKLEWKVTNGWTDGQY